MDTLKRLFQSKEEKHRREFENACKQCSALVKQREFCWSKSLVGSKETDECFTEELQEKKCMSQFLCNSIHKNFYEISSCHLWAEYFAHKNDNVYINGKHEIDDNPELREVCTKLTHQMSKCMSVYMKYSHLAADGERYVNHELK